MSDNGTKPDHDALAAAIARALKPQFDGLGDRLERIDGRLQGVETRLQGVDSRLQGVETRLDRIIDNTGEHYRRLDARVGRLEAKVFGES